MDSRLLRVSGRSDADPDCPIADPDPTQVTLKQSNLKKNRIRVLVIRIRTSGSKPMRNMDPNLALSTFSLIRINYLRRCGIGIYPFDPYCESRIRMQPFRALQIRIRSF